MLQRPYSLALRQAFDAVNLSPKSVPISAWLSLPVTEFIVESLNSLLLLCCQENSVWRTLGIHPESAYSLEVEPAVRTMLTYSGTHVHASLKARLNSLASCKGRLQNSEGVENTWNAQEGGIRVSR